MTADEEFGGASAEALKMEVAILREALARSERRVEELTVLADQDPLVGVLNRRAFVRQLSRAVAGHERHSHRAMLVGIDVDGMRAIKDRYGRAAGDAVLAHIGAVVSAHVRTTDAVGRLGADDFGIVLAFAEEGARNKMARLVAKISGTPIDWQGKSLRIRARFALRNVAEGGDAEAQLTAVACLLHEGRPVEEGALEVAAVA